MIIKYELKYRAVVLDILSQTLGTGYIENIEEISTKKNVHALVALEEKRITGFGYGYKADRDWLRRMTPFLKVKPPPDIQDASMRSTLGVIQTIAVNPENHGRGIGTALVKELEALLWQSNCTSIIVPAWEHGEGTNIYGIVNSGGFRYWARVDGYWQTECDNREFDCPARNDSCVCNLVLYKKTLAS